MKIEINLNIEGAINNALAPEKLTPLLESAVNAAIKSAIEDATGYRSEFRKALEAQLKEVMPHGLGVSDVAKFQHVLNAAMNKLVDAANNEAVKAAMEKAVKSVMPDVPAKIKMSDLIKAARDGFHKEDHEAFYANYRESEYGGGGWLALDANEDCRSAHSADIRLSITKEGEVYSLKFNGEQVTPNSLPNAIGYMDSLLLSMYVGRTSIEMDIDADDIEHFARDQTSD